MEHEFGRDLTKAVGEGNHTAQAAEKLRTGHLARRGVNVFFQYYPEYEPRQLEGGWTSTTVNFETPYRQYRPDAVGDHAETAGNFYPGKTL